MKKIHNAPWVAPPPDEVLKRVEYHGGRGAVSRMTHKAWSTVDRWCRGEIRIDFANWELLKRDK